MHEETETQWGLRLASWALLLYLGAILAGVSSAFVLRIILLQEPYIPAYSFYLFLFTLPATLLSATSAIIFLLGFSTMYRHRGEPGSVRDRNLKRSFLLLLGSIVALITGWAVTLFLPFLLPTALALDAFRTLQAVRVVLSLGIGIILAFLLALLLYYVVVSLAPERLMSRLNLAVVLFVLSAIVTFALALASMWTDLPLQEFNEAFVAPSALALLLFWSVYRASQRSLDPPPSQSLST